MAGISPKPPLGPPRRARRGPRRQALTDAVKLVAAHYLRAAARAVAYFRIELQPAPTSGAPAALVQP